MTTTTEQMTDLEKDCNGKFWLGRRIAVHRIGEYQFLEYAERGVDNHPTHPRQETGRICFSAYINEKSTCSSYGSLDAALVGVVARKHDGPNSKAAYYFMKMIAADEE